MTTKYDAIQYDALLGTICGIIVGCLLVIIIISNIAEIKWVYNCIDKDIRILSLDRREQ